MTFRIFAVVLASWIGIAIPTLALAQVDAPEAPVSRPVRGVLELFTSQGCSSCPPADRLLKMYIDDKDIIALTLPVDYWDYLGWKDTFATAKNTARQRAYAQRRNDGAVYTPQIVVNGGDHVVGSNRLDIDAAIARARAGFAEAQVPLRFWHERNALVIQAGTGKPGHKYQEATIWLAVMQKTVSVPVRGGENSGKTLNYHNVVREITPVGLWNGEPLMLRLALNSVMYPESEDSVVLIQEGEAGRIIGAAFMGQ